MTAVLYLIWGAIAATTIWVVAVVVLAAVRDEIDRHRASLRRREAYRLDQLEQRQLAARQRIGRL